MMAFTPAFSEGCRLVPGPAAFGRGPSPVMEESCCSVQARRKRCQGASARSAYNLGGKSPESRGALDAPPSAEDTTLDPLRPGNSGISMHAHHDMGGLPSEPLNLAEHNYSPWEK